MLQGSIAQSVACLAAVPQVTSSNPSLATQLAWRLSGKIISMVILSLLLIQEEQLSVTGESTVKQIRGHKNSVNRLTDQLVTTLIVLTGP